MTDLHELLTRVADEKQSELSESVQGGDAIAFDNVDIYTPADVLLVKDLSFRIQDGAAGCLNVQRTTGFHRKKTTKRAILPRQAGTGPTLLMKPC